MNKDEILKKASETPDDKKAWVVAVECITCSLCEQYCPTQAITIRDVAHIDRDLCVADGACVSPCPTGAIKIGVEDPKESSGK